MLTRRAGHCSAPSTPLGHHQRPRHMDMQHIYQDIITYSGAVWCQKMSCPQHLEVAIMVTTPGQPDHAEEGRRSAGRDQQGRMTALPV